MDNLTQQLLGDMCGTLTCVAGKLYDQAESKELPADVSVLRHGAQHSCF